MSYAVTLPLEAAPQFRDWFKMALNQVLQTTARRLESEAYSLIPLGKTGGLRSSFHVDATGDMLRLVFDADYAKYVDKGAPLHTIEPVRSKVLRFNVGGKTVFAPRVTHPGIRGANFTSEIKERAITIFKDELFNMMMANPPR